MNSPIGPDDLRTSLLDFKLKASAQFAFRLDAVCGAVFGYDFDCLSGRDDALSLSLDELTNNEHRASSFYMRALFWIFPSILKTGRKGDIIQQTKKLLGEVATTMWQDAKDGGDRGGRSLMAQLRKFPLLEGNSAM